MATFLACAEGHHSKVVAKRLRMSQVTVCKWRGRFVRDRLDGLYDEPRPGTPRQISDEQIEQVIMDNYGTHKTAMIRNWFAKRPRFHVHFTPTYDPG